MIKDILVPARSICPALSARGRARALSDNLRRAACHSNSFRARSFISVVCSRVNAHYCTPILSSDASVPPAVLRGNELAPSPKMKLALATLLRTDRVEIEDSEALSRFFRECIVATKREREREMGRIGRKRGNPNGCVGKEGRALRRSSNYLRNYRRYWPPGVVHHN